MEMCVWKFLSEVNIANDSVKTVLCVVIFTKNLKFNIVEVNAAIPKSIQA